MKIFTSLIMGILFTGSAVAQDALTHLSGCEDADFVTAESGSTIETRGSAYTPKCLRIVVGSTVSIVGSNPHPLQGIESLVGTPANPIFDDLGAHISKTEFTFDSTGEFGYYCVAHGTDAGTGMAGSILVVPAAP
jgi:plastocyanin